ncbi:MAG TPA: leucyl aminopeptidase [Lachnospiraceae bacterium]
MERLVFNKEEAVKVIYLESGQIKDYPELTFYKDVFKADYLETLLVASKEKKVLFVGWGEESLTDKNTLMELGAKACKILLEKDIDRFCIDLRDMDFGVDYHLFYSWVKGIYLGSRKGKSYKSDQKEQNPKISLLVNAKDIDSLKKYEQEAFHITDAIFFARDMVNMPSNYLYPESFISYIKDFCKDMDLEIEVLNQKDMEEKRMGGILTVGASSAKAPYLCVIRYKGAPKEREVFGLVGKGVTVDTGGYDLKPSSYMAGIRGDMGGAAAVIGAIRSLAVEKKKVNAIAILPLCENRIAPGSYLQGDVITSYSGKTIEVRNTDAEGRIILADALSYAITDEKVTKVLDIATLTGAVVGMFGFTIGGVMSNSEKMWKSYEEASCIAGEKHWRIPYGKEHEKMIESKVADIKNVGESVCGTITAGLFIKSFAKDLPWIHVDIAGTAWVDSPIYAYQEAFATGVCVDTIYQWLKNSEDDCGNS